MSDRLAQIQARTDAATEGPWSADDGSYNVYGAEGYMVCADLADGETSEFIAHAREDVPYLLAMVRELQGRVDAGLALADKWAALAPADDWGEGGMDATVLADAGRAFRAAITATEGA